MTSKAIPQGLNPSHRVDSENGDSHSKLASHDRLVALDRSGLLDSPPEEVFDRATRLVSRVLNAPVGFVSLVTPERQFFKSQTGLSDVLGDKREIPLSHSLCQHIVTSQVPLVINDARLDPMAKENPAIEDFGVVAYLGVPLSSSDGEILGAFCAVDIRPRTWSQHDVATMQDIADMLSREITLRIRSRSVERLVHLFDQVSHWELPQTENLRREVGELFSELASTLGACDENGQWSPISLIEVKKGLASVIQRHSDGSELGDYSS